MPGQAPTFTHNVVCPTVQPSLNGHCSTIAQKALNSLDNPHLKGILIDLLDKLSEKDNQIRLLTNRVVDLELRVNECEKFSSKGNIIFDNLPPDDTPENGNTATKFVVDNDSTPTAASIGKSSSNGRKVYDRDFLLSKQKAAGSLKKAPFTQESQFKDIVTHSPQFLQPLADNVPVNDFRDFSQSSHKYGNSSLGGFGNDFAPDWLRRQRPMVNDVCF